MMPSSDVEEREREEWDDEAGHRGHGVGGTKDTVHDPRLPADFRDRPTGLDGDEAHGRREREGAEQQAIVGQCAPSRDRATSARAPTH